MSHDYELIEQSRVYPSLTERNGSFPKPERVGGLVWYLFSAVEEPKSTATMLDCSLE